MGWDCRGINFCACSSGRLEEFAEGLGKAATEMSAELKDRAGSDSGTGLLRDELRNPTMPTGDKNLRDGTRSYSSPHYGIVDLVPTDEIPTDENRRAC
jgi:hypothetical protein